MGVIVVRFKGCVCIFACVRACMYDYHITASIKTLAYVNKYAVRCMFPHLSGVTAKSAT